MSEFGRILVDLTLPPTMLALVAAAVSFQSHINTRQSEELAALNRDLQHQATHDSLTGLPNRTKVLEEIDKAISRFRRRSTYACAVLFLDLNDFKTVNDLSGHSGGDTALIEIARRLQAYLRPGDLACRL